MQHLSRFIAGTASPARFTDDAGVKREGIARTWEQWEEELGLTRKRFRRVLKTATALGYIVRARRIWTQGGMHVIRLHVAITQAYINELERCVARGPKAYRRLIAQPKGQDHIAHCAGPASSAWPCRGSLARRSSWKRMGEIRGADLGSIAEVGADRVKAGTIADLVARYYRSAEFVGLKASTQATYRSIIEPFRVDHGDKRAAMLERRHVKDMLAAKASTPTAANNWLKRMRQLMVFAIDAGMRADDPTIGVKPLPIRSPGHPAWMADDVVAFREKHPSGTRARLAMEMALCTMQRRGDLVRMGRQHIQGGLLVIRQQKTGTVVEIPILPELQAELDTLPGDQLTFLVTEQGRAFTAAGFGNWFRDMAAGVGLPTGYNSHGLRKAGATRGAEAGWTDHEIMAWGGWKSLSEVQRYTRAVNRRKLAQGAVHKLTRGTSSD